MIEEELELGTVDLGFAEKCEPWKLQSHFFPSKIGGKPAWLNLQDIPSADRVQCRVCQGPCIFLCQVYAPIESQDECFHRTIFIFICPNVDCCLPNQSDNFKVLRCQLSRRNDFFSVNPPVESPHTLPERRVEELTKVCRVCNLKGTSHCGKCRNVNYCSREHQVADWRAGHKLECAANEVNPQRPLPLLLPEWEIETEPEPDIDDLRGGKVERSDEEKLKEYESLVNAGKAGTLHDTSVDADLNAMAGEKEDQIFKKFKKRISEMPKQILRYEKDGTPLWVCGINQPTSIPPCEYCGNERTFEFQVLPQMLNYLSLDQVGKSIDWGTLAVFTCKNSCSSGDTYKAEYIFKQDILQ
ncbi:programmed cell death protein 2 [Neocloeon triangulifer]|uniref:programmed cell death protein 2 n=1 Tax=Neocloeon triangulifer TaxID=2078957 RepID=UPI00286ED594|nr:programmed cell death protein 2 [Neocloeon triangulifer]